MGIAKKNSSFKGFPSVRLFIICTSFPLNDLIVSVFHGVFGNALDKILVQTAFFLRKTGKADSIPFFKNPVYLRQDLIPLQGQAYQLLPFIIFIHNPADQQRPLYPRPFPP